MSTLSTHVLDTSLGKPGEGIHIRLEVASSDGNWQTVGQGITNVDGRLRDFGPSTTKIVAGTYRLIFDTASYFSKRGTIGFYPQVSVVFEIRNNNEHYHLPLLLSPYGYSTYRGS